MRLRRAVPKIPAKSSVPHGLPLNKSRALLSRSESTLLQLLIPLPFNSCISKLYNKSQGEAPPPAPKFVNSSIPARPSRAHAETPATPFRSYAYCITSGHPRWGVSPRRDSQSWLSPPHSGSRATEHRSPATAPMVRSYRCATTRKVPESRLLPLGGTPGNIFASGGV
jgi:hypothetical protein